MRIAIVVAAVALVAIFLAIQLEKAPVFVPRPSTAIAVHKAGPPWAYPEPSCTPGSTNPDITQDTRLKREQIREWGLAGTTADYDEDHFISLDLGGNPTDPRNLWPEPYGISPGARQKDVVDRYLHAQVCMGAMTLQEAQNAITTDWYRVYLHIH